MRKIRIFAIFVVLIFAITACKTETEVSSENNSEVASAENETSEEESLESSEVSEPEDGVSGSEEVSEEVSEDAPETGAEQENASEPENSDVENKTSEESSAPEEGSESSEDTTSEEIDSEEPEFDVQEHNAVLFVKKAVNVRKGPSTDYEKIGSLKKGEQIQITGIADTGWYQIQYGDMTAYVSSSYLIDEASYQAMIAEEEALAAQQAAAEQQAAEQAAAEQQAAAQQQAAQQTQGDYRAQVVALMNQERAAAGVGGISQNASLDAVAQVRAQEIVQSFAHTRPDGSSCFTVLDQNGIVYMTAGENIAAGYGTPADVMAGWMNSEGHRANILNGSFGQVGIGYYTDPNTPYGTYWVQIFTN